MHEFQVKVLLSPEIGNSSYAYVYEKQIHNIVLRLKRVIKSPVLKVGDKNMFNRFTSRSLDFKHFNSPD